MASDEDVTAGDPGDRPEQSRQDSMSAKVGDFLYVNLLALSRVRHLLVSLSQPGLPNKRRAPPKQSTEREKRRATPD